MNSFRASDLQREGAKVFNAVEAVGAVKITSTVRDDMYLITGEQLHKVMTSETQREVFFQELRA